MEKVVTVLEELKYDQLEELKKKLENANKSVEKINDYKNAEIKHLEGKLLELEKEVNKKDSRKELMKLEAKVKK